MAVGSFLGERRALSPGRRNSIMYKELDSFSHSQTIVVKTTSEIVDTFLLYQTIQPPSTARLVVSMLHDYIFYVLQNSSFVYVLIGTH